MPVIGSLGQAAVANIYYTIMDYAGEGVLKSINLGATTMNVHNITIKITIDGVVYLEEKGADHFTEYCIGRDLTGDWKRSMTYDWGLVYFETQLKVEFKCTAGVSIFAMVMYQIYS